MIVFGGVRTDRVEEVVQQPMDDPLKQYRCVLRRIKRCILYQYDGILLEDGLE
jgi:hypothetical protein